MTEVIINTQWSPLTYSLYLNAKLQNLIWKLIFINHSNWYELLYWFQVVDNNKILQQRRYFWSKLSKLYWPKVYWFEVNYIDYTVQCDDKVDMESWDPS